MDTIKFKDWKENPQLYEKRFDGFNQFEITFKEWAECGDDLKQDFIDYVLKGANYFLLIDQNNNETNQFDITEDDLNNFEFFGGQTPPSNEDKGLPYEGVKKKVYKQGSTYNVQGFYTTLLLFCIKKNVLDDDYIQKLRSRKGTNFYIRIKDKGIPIHTGVNVEDLFRYAIELIEKLIKKYEDYKNYKIIFIPNKNNNSENDNNGGNNKMSDKDTNLEINAYISEKIDAHKQIIFTGAPGTGKTYSVREYVKNATQNDESRYKFVQFHSSYDYTDFVEGIRPAPKGNGTTNNSGENMFVRMDGTFKAFCRKIVNANIKDLEKHGIDNIEALYKIMKESKTDPDAIKERRENIAKAISKLPMYYFVIDEINRADLSKVFGELMFGLEEDYRGVQNRFPTQYSNLPTYEMKEDKAVISEKDCFKNGFFVPENLTIIGTMNDIDRSVETFDFALRRRFAWVEIKANEVMLYSVASINNKSKDEVEDIVKKIQEMNEIISGEGKKLGLNESYHIGPAYFKNLFDSNGNDNRETIFNEKIEPLLREYTRGRNSEKVEALISGCKNALFDKSKTTDTSGGNNG